MFGHDASGLGCLVCTSSSNSISIIRQTALKPFRTASPPSASVRIETTGRDDGCRDGWMD